MVVSNTPTPPHAHFEPHYSHLNTKAIHLYHSHKNNPLKHTKMERPTKYTVICNKTKKVLYHTNIAPLLHELETWEQTENPLISVRKKTMTVYVNTRYDAELRLYNYITYTKKGVDIPKYSPYIGTLIGIDTPILNF